MVDAAAKTWTYTYDVGGRQLSMTEPLTRVERTTYDAAGRPTRSDRYGPGGTGAALSTLTRYDAAGNVVGATVVDGYKDIYYLADYARTGKVRIAKTDLNKHVPKARYVFNDKESRVYTKFMEDRTENALQVYYAVKGAAAAYRGGANWVRGLRSGKAPAVNAPNAPRTDFVASSDGVVVPTSRARLEGGFRDAGLPSRPTTAAGTEYTLPNGSLVRVMEPAGQAPLRASFTNANGGPINPFTGKPVQPPGLTPAERLAYVRKLTHVELGP